MLLRHEIWKDDKTQECVLLGGIHFHAECALPGFLDNLPHESFLPHRAPGIFHSSESDMDAVWEFCIFDSTASSKIAVRLLSASRNP